ncbi:elongation factor G [Clostridium fallax]|nr:elongation factor G [Clostridium fallax]
MIMESVAETDENLLDKYFNEGKLSDEEIYSGLIKGCASGDIAPVMCGSSTELIGINSLLDNIINCLPSPSDGIPERAKELPSGEEIEVKINEKR